MAKQNNTGAVAKPAAPVATIETPKAAPNRYYVRHPIMRGGLMDFVTVVGFDADKGNMNHVPRKHVIDVAPGAEAAVAKWINAKCIEPYDPKEHTDALLGPGPQPKVEKKNTAQSSPIVMNDDPDMDDNPKSDNDQAKPI